MSGEATNVLAGFTLAGGTTSLPYRSGACRPGREALCAGDDGRWSTYHHE